MKTHRGQLIDLLKETLASESTLILSLGSGFGYPATVWVSN